MRDLHIHTKFSCDSETPLELYIEKALACGIKELCFTDHVDLNKNDYGYNYYSPDKFFESFQKNKENYHGKISLLSGIEFSEPHLYKEKLQELASYPYDFIIGSVHWVGDMFPCQKVVNQYSAKEFYTLYWKEVLEAVKIGGFNALGHIDFPKRYYGEICYTETMMNEIFKYLLDKDAVIEINTSSLRKELSETMPGKELLELYKANGGKYVTLGSDAHFSQDLAANFNVSKQLLINIGLKEVVYRNRNRVVI